ncbi:uncharacterized protein SPSC_03817 [Sporisorium scitamineum]|uniref:Uncharacterized protein n=1 Tax=Sporisorium scitamineum TaxID=49012 RepID=A0A127Z4F3_9BASI|nr:uncharacterized protein SPSC_03817 [Sporisorium scitamineum]
MDPDWLMIFARHFPGHRNFFTELAVFRQATWNISAYETKEINHSINMLALARVATIRPASECGFLLQDSSRCTLLRRAPSSAPARRCQTAQAVSVQQVSLGTSAQLYRKLSLSHPIHLCQQHRQASTRQEHQCSGSRAGHAEQSMLDSCDRHRPRHGRLESSIPASKQPRYRALKSALEQVMVSCATSVEEPEHQHDLAKLTQIHMAIFVADYADLAMQTVVTLLDKSRTIAHAQACLDRWLAKQSAAAATATCLGKRRRDQDDEANREEEHSDDSDEGDEHYEHYGRDYEGDHGNYEEQDQDDNKDAAMSHTNAILQPDEIVLVVDDDTLIDDLQPVSDCDPVILANGEAARANATDVFTVLVFGFCPFRLMYPCALSCVLLRRA